jgi:exonuclease SbcD
MPFRFVHAADIHLDSPLRSLALRDLELAELIGNATRRAFADIIDLCLDEQVDALVAAGDLYDGEQTSMKTALFLSLQLRKLHEAGIQVFIIRGNHDALSRITKELTLPETVKVFGGRAEAVQLSRGRGDVPIAIHGLSFAQPHAPDSLLGRYKAPIEGSVNIGLMHTSLDGSPGHDRYAPCSVGDLQNSGFDYWALGHIHKRSVIDGRCKVVMPGMPQGRDINEAGSKTVSLVTVADDRSIEIEERLISVAQFERISVDLAGIDDWRDMVAAIGARLTEARGAAASEHLIGRLRLTGATPLAWRIRSDIDLIKTEAVALAFDVGKCWIEGVEIACTAPVQPENEGAALSAVPVAELWRLIRKDILSAEGFQAELRRIADELRGQLPPECRHFLGSDEAGFQTRMAELAQEGVEDVLARLQATPTAEAG